MPDYYFGRKLEDLHTGLRGVATAKTEFENGCIRYLLEYVDKEGEPKEMWFDFQRLMDPETRDRVQPNDGIVGLSNKAIQQVAADNLAAYRQAETEGIARTQQAIPGGPGPVPPRRDPPKR